MEKLPPCTPPPPLHYKADLTHEFLCCEDQFVVDEPAWPVLVQAAVRVYLDSLLVLHSLVVPRLTKASGVVEKPCSDGLACETPNRKR